MSDLIHEENRRARKTYDCMAYEWLENCLFDCDGLTFTERRALVTANRERGKILPGMEYVRQALRDGGDIYTFRARPELHAICVKLDMYEG